MLGVIREVARDPATMAFERAVGFSGPPGVRRGGGVGRRTGEVEPDLAGVRMARGGEGAGVRTEDAETKVSSEEAVSRLPSPAPGSAEDSIEAAVGAEAVGDTVLLSDLLSLPRGFGGVGGRVLLTG